MASLYVRARSPFWWIQYLDAGKRVNRSTGLRADDPADTATARVQLAKIQQAEQQAGSAAALTESWAFVPGFLVEHCVSPKTLNRYMQAWKWISQFCADHGINSPRDVRFRHASEFVAFRTGWKKRNTGSQVTKNTALLDLKVWGLILQRAVRLELADANPLTRIGIRKDAPAEKPEICADEFEAIERALETAPDWMRWSFAIARLTGCRLGETVIRWSDIDFAREIVHFRNPKGGKSKAFSVPLPAALKALLLPLRTEHGQTLAMPFQPSRAWGQFFARIGLPHLCFHCLRVSFVTGLARSGVPQAVAMRLVNHGSSLVHRIYQRLNVDDLREWVDRAPR